MINMSVLKEILKYMTMFKEVAAVSKHTVHGAA
jgi:hypothetical protein